MNPVPEQNLHENKMATAAPLPEALEGHRAFLSRANGGSKSIRAREGFFFKRCSSSMPRPTFSPFQQTTSQSPNSCPMGKAPPSTVQIWLLGGESKGGMGLRSPWRSRPRGHFVLTHRRPLSCLHVGSWKLTPSRG